jgi:gluconolactonase
LPQGIGPVEKFADVSGTPQGQFLAGGSFGTQGNLWLVAIGSGWISYLTPDGKLVPVVNCNPAAELGQTCEPQGSRWRGGKLYLTTRPRGILAFQGALSRLDRPWGRPPAGAIINSAAITCRRRGGRHLLH